MFQNKKNYSAEFKKGDVGEIFRLLQVSNAKRNISLQKELVKRVCAYMSLGIDVSSLFSEMIMATNTRDLVQKKLVYNYIAYYVKQNEKTALLAINTYHKDCNDDNPIVRGMALRSLASLNVPKLIEYILPMVVKGMDDSSAYVRRTAAISASKVYFISPNAVKDSKIIDKLYDMIRDRDTTVIINSLNSLDEILVDEGGLVTTPPMILHLLSKINDFTEWEVGRIVEIISAKFVPQSDDDIISIMNILDDKLNMSNYFVVISVISLFLKFSQLHSSAADPSSSSSLISSILDRIKEPLVTIMSGERKEISYDALKQIQFLIIHFNTNVFTSFYQLFYPIYSDPNYLNLLKISILSLVFTSENSFDIFSNLCGVIMEDRLGSNIEMINETMKCLAKIALNDFSILKFALQKFLSFVDLKLCSVSSPAFIILCQITRKYVTSGEEIVNHIKDSLCDLFEIFNDEAKACTFWLIENYSHLLPHYCYFIEYFIPQFHQFPSCVQLSIVSSSMRMFFKSPAEMYPILSSLFSTCLSPKDDENVNMHVKDKISFYYQLLLSSVHSAEEVINNIDDKTITEFSDFPTIRIPEEVFEEMNTFSVIYNLPSSAFTTQPKTSECDDDEDEDYIDSDEDDRTTSTNSSNLVSADPILGSVPRVEEPPKLDGKQIVEQIIASLTAGHSLSDHSLFALFNERLVLLFADRNDIEMSPQLFQSLWSSPSSFSYTKKISCYKSFQLNENSIPSLEEKFANSKIFSIASVRFNLFEKSRSFYQNYDNEIEERNVFLLFF